MDASLLKKFRDSRFWHLRHGPRNMDWWPEKKRTLASRKGIGKGETNSTYPSPVRKFAISAKGSYGDPVILLGIQLPTTFYSGFHSNGTDWIVTGYQNTADI